MVLLPLEAENWVPPPEEMDESLLSCTSFFLLFSRNSFALALSLLGRGCDLERERLREVSECGLSLDGFRFRRGVASSESLESSSLLPSSSSECF